MTDEIKDELIIPVREECEPGIDDLDWKAIDWEEIVLSTQDDYEAGRYCFNSEDYATEEEVTAAMLAFLHSIAERVERNASDTSLDATG